MKDPSGEAMTAPSVEATGAPPSVEAASLAASINHDLLRKNDNTNDYLSQSSRSPSGYVVSGSFSQPKSIGTAGGAPGDVVTDPFSQPKSIGTADIAPLDVVTDRVSYPKSIGTAVSSPPGYVVADRFTSKSIAMSETTNSSRFKPFLSSFRGRKSSTGIYSSSGGGGTSSSPSVSSRVTFRQLSEDSVPESSTMPSRSASFTSSSSPPSFLAGTPLVEAVEKEVTIVDDNYSQELPGTSRISLAYQDATLPLALDNERFFNSEDDIGYQKLLNQALQKMNEMRKEQRLYWHEGNNETFYNNNSSVLSRLCRALFHTALSWTGDTINRLSACRNAGHSLQEHLPFLTAYESFVMGGVIKEFDVVDDGKFKNDYHIRLALQNINTSRAIGSTIFHFRRWAWFFHLSTGMKYSRQFAIASQFCSIFNFPASENFPPSKEDSWRITLLRVWHVLVYWFVSMFGLIRFPDDYKRSHHRAVNDLAQGGHGLESNNREYYGTYFGREKTTEFRKEHRQNIDEAIVRSFMGNPIGTMLDNGCEHVLRCMAKHWKDMLYQENGNFAHHRLEQLSPFDVLRSHIPEVLCTLAGIRGRNVWDMTTLGPFVRKLQSLDPGRVQKRRNEHDEESGKDDSAEILGACMAAQSLILEMKKNIVFNVCGGIPSRIEPFVEWLDLIGDSFIHLCNEAEALRDFVATVDTGVKLGYEVLRLVRWNVPSEEDLKKAVINHILNKNENEEKVPRDAIFSALSKLAAKDERTLRELLQQGLGHIRAAKLLLRRTTTLLEREIRRRALDDRIVELSKGSAIMPDALERNNWYWVKESNDDVWHLLTFKGRSLDSKQLKFLDTVIGIDCVRESHSVEILHYIPVAEAISRAQKAFMTIELDHGKTFTYNTFMEFGSTQIDTSLRNRLRRLITLAQVHCSELDKARLNVLAETRNSVRNPKRHRDSSFRRSRFIPQARPQNAIFLGGGPTGLLGAIHCLHNVILTGGEVKMYEGRDAFDQEASSFERAQIVRLDARLISMLRFHLGTGFEDVFIPAKGETEAHLGNIYTSQGFVEVTIKRLESMLLDEVINLRSKGLIHFYSDSKIDCDLDKHVFKKKGKSLKVGDLIYDDSLQGNMIVKGFVYEASLQQPELAVGVDYDIVLPREKKVRTYRLVEMDSDFDWYQFIAHEPGLKDLCGEFHKLPPIYAHGCGRIDPSGITLEDSESVEIVLEFDLVKGKDFVLDVSKSHVILSSGKPAASTSHFTLTTPEPYAVCCIEGLKISMGMHDFGETRWGNGVRNEYRSFFTSNKRIVGDFMKGVQITPIVQTMKKKLASDSVWKYHFDHLPTLMNDNVSALHSHLQSEFSSLMSSSFHRRSLQTRFFELGNNYYLGMELPREYESWKSETISKIVPDKPEMAPDAVKAVRGKLQRTLAGHIDRLWYEATIEVISNGNVYNFRGRSKIPSLYTVDSPFEQTLGELEEQEAFRMFQRTYRVQMHEPNGFTSIQHQHETEMFQIPTKTYVRDLSTNCKVTLGELERNDLFEPIDTFEILAKEKGHSIVRSSNGYIALMPDSVRVGRVSDLSRAPNGYSESNVALASFPVAHTVSHNTLRVNRTQGKRGDEGFITAFVGDAQASPHFMRYSGLTGAGINCMSFNNLVGQAFRGSALQDCVQRYSFETNWSNSEVVRRGTGSNYGEDGFLRPAFNYRKLVDYLYDKVEEQIEISAYEQPLLSRDWKTRIAASLVPRGLENDTFFNKMLIDQLIFVLHGKMNDEVKKLGGKAKLSPDLWTAIAEEKEKIGQTPRSNEVIISFASITDNSRLQQQDDFFRIRIREIGAALQVVMNTLKETVDYAMQLRVENKRISSELYNQPKPVDTLIDEFALDSQTMINEMCKVVALTVGTIGIYHYEKNWANTTSALLGILNVFVAFGVLLKSLRYRVRNANHKIYFQRRKMERVMKDIFSQITRSQRDLIRHHNPFETNLQHLFHNFVRNAKYYNMEKSKVEDFRKAFENFKDSTQSDLNTIKFIRQIVQEFIVDKFHENSYLQEDLVLIYSSLLEHFSLDSKGEGDGMTGANELFCLLLQLKSVLNGSIDDDGSYYSILPSTLQFFLAPISGGKKVVREVTSIKKIVDMVSPYSNKLGRSMRDLRELCHATIETERASVIAFSAAGIMLFSTVFTCFRLIQYVGDADGDLGITEAEWMRLSIDNLSWFSVVALPGATLVCGCFVKRLKHLCHIGASLARTKSKNPQLTLIRRIMEAQIFITVLQLAVTVLGLVALFLSLVLATWGMDSFLLSANVPVFLSIATVTVAFSVDLFASTNEYWMRFNLDPCLGQAICNPFEKLINNRFDAFSNNTGLEIETKQDLDKESWEYTGRDFLHELRFDTILDVDRLGTILQYIQSGNRQPET